MSEEGQGRRQDEGGRGGGGGGDEDGDRADERGVSHDRVAMAAVAPIIHRPRKLRSTRDAASDNANVAMVLEGNRKKARSATTKKKTTKQYASPIRKTLLMATRNL